jgi:hypothetical protein
MSADDLNKITLTGKIEKKNLGGTSKSAHLGFVLQTEQGAIKLRRDGGNPFYDDFFEKYENREMLVEGYDMEGYFLVTDIRSSK